MKTSTQNPEPGDYILSDCGRLGARTSVGQCEGSHLGEYGSADEALQMIRSKMSREGYWPNVWYQDDHGGLQIVEAES